MFATGWFATLMLKTWFKPAIYAVGGLLLVSALSGFIYYKVDEFKTTSYNQGYTAAKVEFADAALTKLQELTKNSDLLSAQTMDLANALTTNQDAFGKLVAKKIEVTISNDSLLKIIDGKCRPTTEVKKTWNDLQKMLVE